MMTIVTNGSKPSPLRVSTRNVVVLIAVVLIFINSVKPEDTEADGLCFYKDTCDACVKASYTCMWCVSDLFEDNIGRTGRCAGNASNCPGPLDGTNVINVKSSHVVTSSEGGSSTYDVKLRDDEEYKIHLEVEAQPNLPFQMYYLIDGSRSMLSALDSVKESSKQLAKDVFAKWKNSKVGLGIFNDKETMPFTFLNLTVNGIVDNIPETEFPFWKMVVKLTTSQEALDSNIDGISIGTFLDPDNDPESQLDVFSQVLQCKTELHFEEESDTRHLVFLTTDAPFWVAGDGRYGGIINPTLLDYGCRGDDTDSQSKGSTKYDYPSVGFLKDQMQQQRVYLVASVTNDIHEDSIYFHKRSFAAVNDAVYESLSEAMPGMVEYVGNTYDSSDTSSTLQPLNVEVVMSRLDAISKRVSLVASGETSSLVINYDIKCPTPEQQKIVREKVVACDQMSPGEKATIIVGIKRKENAITSNAVTFQLNLPGVHAKEDLVTVKVTHLDANCSDCHPPGTFDCVNGELSCAVCICKESWHGETCECNTKANVPECKVNPDSAEDKYCAGNGDCYCGECECFKNVFGLPYVGPKCQCDPSSCPKGRDGDTCSGKGDCFCNVDTGNMECDCESKDGSKQWTHNCECRPKSFCVEDVFETTCNNRSDTCRCDGTCACFMSFNGDKCELCSSESCLSALCDEDRYKEAARCTREGDCTQVYKDHFTLERIGDGRVYSNGDNYTTCSSRIDECQYAFYIDKSNILSLKVIDKVICVTPFPVWTIIVCVAALVFFLGLLVIVVWKMYVVYQEKKEYKEFLEKQKGAKSTGINPLYQEAEGEVQNPNYRAQ